MSAAREELAQIIQKALGDVTGIYDTSESEDQQLADAIIAAGYRKPRTITTEAELDALPARSVVRSEQTTIWEKFDGTLTGVFWADTFNLGQHPSGHIALPATVLWEPEA